MLVRAPPGFRDAKRTFEDFHLIGEEARRFVPALLMA